MSPDRCPEEGPEEGTAGRRPHLLVLLTDQLAAHALSAAGAEHLATPHLDALAERGTRFTRAYAAFPLCVPSRASMLTGRHPHELGIDGNRVDEAVQPGRDPASLGHRLTALGYDCAYGGKWHVPRPEVSAEDGFVPVAPFGDVGLAERAAAWLRTRRDDPTPFALVVSFDDPHTICEYARGQPLPYGDVVEVGERELPPLPANFGPQPFEPEALRAEQAAAATTYGTLGWGPQDWRRYRHAYARLVERVDARIGVVLDALAGSGLAAETVVVLTSDHGDGDAAHAWNQKTALFEESCRVPLVLADPRVPGPPATSDRLVSVGLDLLPTLLGLAGGRADELGGADLARALRDSDRERPSEVVVETCFQRLEGPQTRGRALITERYKYVVYSWGRHREQLFDLTADPGEQRNLAVESRFDPVLEDCRTRLLAWCRRTGDRAFLKRLVLPADVTEGVRAELFAVPY